MQVVREIAEKSAKGELAGMLGNTKYEVTVVTVRSTKGKAGGLHSVQHTHAVLSCRVTSAMQALILMCS